MVASFHIPELQILLGLLKLNKYGRKSELLQRAQAAVSRGVNRQIQEEIRELYRCCLIVLIDIILDSFLHNSTVICLVTLFVHFTFACHMTCEVLDSEKFVFVMHMYQKVQVKFPY